MVPDLQLYNLFLALCCMRELPKHLDKQIAPCPYRKHSSTSEKVSYILVIKYVQPIAAAVSFHASNFFLSDPMADVHFGQPGLRGGHAVLPQALMKEQLMHSHEF